MFALRHPKTAPRLATDWLRRADEATRTKVMELVRTSPKHTVGEAFTQALHDCSTDWAIPSGEVESHPPERHSTQAEHAHRGASVAPTDDHPCKKWNDGRGCSKPCPDGRPHTCDFRMPGGLWCGVTGHTRADHQKTKQATSPLKDRGSPKGTLKGGGKGVSKDWGGKWGGQISSLSP